MTAPSAAKTRNLSLSETAYEAIKEEILSAKLQSGQLLYESALAERLGMSKTPIREALRRLTQERLVAVMPRKGYVVGGMSMADVVEVFTLRRIIEPHLASMAARQRTSAQVEALRETLARASAPGDGLEAIRNSHAIHEQIAEMAGNRRAMLIVRSLLDDSARIPWMAERLKQYPSDDRPEHAALVESIADGDAKAASAAMAAHIESGLSRLLAVDLDF
jgi:GntR family transcriptional regulator, rspAB operon transcriptional repressor